MNRFSQSFLCPLALCGLLAALCVGCREDEVVVPQEVERLPTTVDTRSGIVGMYLLNEGNMGSNKSTLDYLDMAEGQYYRNIYASRNPDVALELGDVGNDIQVYGGRLWAVINCSNKVEVMDVASGRRIGQVDIPNCRYIAFADGKAYITSYVGPVQAGASTAVRGAVYEVDTASLRITARCTVGYQPDGICIDGENIYVANSGGYLTGVYDQMLSVVNRATMRQVRQIAVGLNLHQVGLDSEGKLWVSSRGDYEDVPSRLHVLRPIGRNGQMELTDTLDIPCSRFCMAGDSLYYFSAGWSNQLQRNTVTYGIINTRTLQRVSSSFITDGTERTITIPYGLIVHPVTREIFITDAKNYVSSGHLHCYSARGERLWSVRTGDIPAAMCFVTRR